MRCICNPQQSLFEVYAEHNTSAGLQMQRIVDNQILLMGHYVYHEYGPNEVAYQLLKYPNQPQNACTLVPDYFLSRAYVNMPNLVNDLFQQSPETPIQNFHFPKDTAICFGSYT